MSLLRRLNLFGALLVLAVALSILAWPRDPLPLDGAEAPSVLELLPNDAALAGWTKKVRPVAETPEIQARVNELLNFSDAVFVDFSRGYERVSIYIAYWEPKRMTQRDVAGHYPDTCWVRSGWDCLAATTEYPVLSDGTSVAPVQRRLMKAAEVEETVYYWHLVEAEGGGFFAYSRQKFSRFRDIMRFGVNQKRRQYFIRVSGNTGDFDPTRWINERHVGLLATGLRAAGDNDA